MLWLFFRKEQVDMTTLTSFLRKRAHLYPVAALLPVVLAAQPALADKKPPQVMATGRCTMVMTPDQASTSVTVAASGSDVNAVLGDATKRFNAFLEAVKALNLPDVKLSGGGVSVAPEYDYDHGKRILRDYRAQGALHIVTTSIARLAEVAPLAAKNGIDEVGAIDPGISDTTWQAAIMECLPKAAADAKERAAAMASGVGMTIGAPLMISDHLISTPSHAPMPMMRAMATAPDATAHVPVTELRKVLAVSASFALVDPHDKSGEGSKEGSKQDDD
ncbi:Hypothetical protein GbCGDNIH6_2063 [Granulibacter bethesdensis]|nr:Hypothetical protein GbCGDNIH6_2063 [Granulibacter bethesdensis]